MVRVLIPFFAALIATALLTPVVRAFARAIGMIANPTGDRWHSKPTALLGGVGVYLGFVIGTLTLPWAVEGVAGQPTNLLGRAGVGILASSSMMFLVGLADDKYKLRPSTKLIFQSLAAAVVISFGVVYPVSPWTTLNVLATFFWFLALTNALNLLDNMDGVAVGVASIAAFFLALTFIGNGAWMLGAICLALAGAGLGFLPYNFHRASIFMGDSGSLFIGSLLASLGAAYPSSASVSIISVLFVPALIVIIPILDTTLVALSRTLAGRPISLGGRDHTTHRLVAMGLSERQVALLLYGFAASGGLLAIVLGGASSALGISLGAIFLVGLLLVAAYLGRLHTYAPGGEQSGRVTVLISDLLHKRRAFEVVLDIILFAVAYQGAYLLRWDGSPPPSQQSLLEGTIALAVVAKSVTFGILGVYRGVWHRSGMADLQRLVSTTIVAGLLTFVTVAFAFPTGEFSRSIFILDAVLAGVLVVGARASFRSLDMVRHALNPPGSPTLIYGAGIAGEFALRESIANPELDLRPVGFIDDDPAKWGRVVHGYPVLGKIEEVEKIVSRRGVKTVLLCSKKLRDDNVQKLLTTCAELDVRVLQMELLFREVASNDNASTAAAQNGNAAHRLTIARHTSGL